MRVANRSEKEGFTLPEVVIASAISVLVIGALLTILVKCFLMWNDARARWNLAQYSRICREKIMRGAVFGSDSGVRVGLRSSSWKTFESEEEGDWSYFEFSPPYVDQKYVVWYYDNSAPWGLENNSVVMTEAEAEDNWNEDEQLDGGSRYIIDPEIKLESMNSSYSNRHVTINMEMYVTIAGKRYTQNQQYTTYLINE